MSNTLLDVFVDVGARGIPQTEQDLQDFINRIAAAFGGLNKGATTAVLNAGKTGAKKAAASIINELTMAVKEFELQKFEFDFQVRLLGDADIRRQLADLQSEVQAAKREFALASDDQSRRAAIDRVRAAQAELRLLEQIAEQARATQGLAGASPAAGDRAKVFQQIRADAATVNLELQQTGKLVGKAADPKLQLSFAGTREQAERLNLELRTAVQNKDFIRAENALQQLQLLRGAIATARSEAEDQIQLKIQVPDLKDEFKQVFGFLKFQLASGDLGSIKVLDATDREAAMRYRAEIAALSDEFGRLSARAELTSGDIARLQEIIEQLDSTRATTGPVAGLNHLQGKISGAAKSFNSLNNNAYQFGQLIEDAAIGYELNGIAGALRGAGNNASFLLQTFIASRVEANQLSFKAGLILTTLSAVGVAAAMMIIPRMQEWLETLDDIDLKIKNIADKLRQEFADVRLRVDLQLDQEAEIRALAEVEDLVDGIEAILRRAQEQADLQLKITAVLNEQSVQDLFTEATDATQQIADAAAQQIIALQARAQALASRAAAAGGRLPDFEQFLSADERDQIQQIEELQSAAEGFNQLRQQIFEDSKKGVIDPAAIEQARDALQTVIDSLEMLKGKLPEDEAKQLEKNLAAAKDEMARLNEDAQKLQAIIDNDNRAFEALKESVKSVSDELQFLNEVNQGLIGEDERVLFDIEKQKQQFAEAAQELINLRGATDEVINALEDLAQKTMVEIVIEGEAELRKVAGQLDKLGEKFDDLNRQLGENAIRAAEKTANAQQKAAEKTADLQARLQEMARKKALELDRRIIESDIEFLRSRMKEFQPDQFTLGDPGTQLMGIGGNVIENEITRLENQLKNMDRAEQDLQQANQIAEINKQIAETQQNLAKELKTIQEERIKADDEVVIEMKNLNDEMTRLREVQQRLEEAIRNFDPTRQMPNALPDAPAQAAEAAVMGSKWIQGVFDQLMQNTPQVPPGPWSAVNPNLPPQAGTGPQFRPEEPVFAPEDMPVLPDAEGMRTAQSRAMDAALSSADFKSSSLEGLIDQSNRLLSTLGDAVMKLDVTARYA
jgi:chromosome segregation ATPase